ncbi:hypothetical protein Adt_34982 [Abeliophyllum distichum]|uniref:Uncharacterized protein n=1 Tax=Abeliophyllum distichum TaxID=126358 RepID=A0ABD1QDE5_9LAMI
MDGVKWWGHVFVVSALFRHENAFACVPNHLSAEEVAEEEGQGGGNRVRVFDDLEPDLDVPSVYGIANFLPRCEVSRDIVDIVRSIYQEDLKTRSYKLILNRHRCLVEFGLMASKGRRPQPTLAHLTKQRPKVLVPGSAEDTSQRKVIEDLSREETGRLLKPRNVQYTPLQRTLAVNTSEEAVLEGPSKSAQVLGGRDGRPYDSNRRFRELIWAPGARIPDDTLWNLPFYPSMGAQAVKKYFTPKWEEFSSHGELEDVLEAKGHCRGSGGYKQGERRLLKEAKSRDEEIQSLRKDLESSENGRKEAEVGRKEVEAKLANAEVEFVANFHNTEAYTNFSDYFARIGQQEVLTALRNDHPNFDIGPLEASFPPSDVEGEEEN